MQKNFKIPANAFLTTDHQEPKEDVESFKVPEGYKLSRLNKSERLQLLVRPDTKTNIKQIAARKGLSMNDLVNQILEAYVNENK